MGSNDLSSPDQVPDAAVTNASAGLAVPYRSFPDHPDPNFEKYARKELGVRRYVPAQVELATLARSTAVTTGLAPYSGSWTGWEAAHLLRRTGFGVTLAAINAVLTQTVGDAVDTLTTVTQQPSLPSATPLNYYQSQLPDSSGVALGSSWTGTNLGYATGSSDSTLDLYRIYSLRRWMWGVYLNDGSSIREKMTQFWFHFIPASSDDVNGAASNSGTICHDYFALLRANATGNFFTLIQAITKSPAMLVYLGGQNSTASAPNENFARELLELFTLGKVPTQNYTEPDIQAAAKVFSGWRVTSFNSPYPFAVAFNNTYHNKTAKTFSAFFGNSTISSQTTGTTTAQAAYNATEFDQFFNLLFTQQATTIARYVCRRLYRFFVYYDIDATAETNIIAPLATLFINSNWEILPVLKTLLKSEHFFDMANRGVMIKSPLDLVAGSLRTFGLDLTPASTTTTPMLDQYYIWKYFEDYCANNLEQGICNVPNVSGWKAFYQTPAFYQNWINSNTIQKRYSMLTTLTTVNGFTIGVSGGTNKIVKMNFPGFVAQFPSTVAPDPDLLMDAVIQLLLPIDLPASQKASIKVRTLLNNQVTNSYWTGIWNTYVSTPGNTTNANQVRDRFRALLVELIGLAEYQLM
ncbi:MAG: DUF1800 family protein [Sphingobacteriales bacterium]|nr:MAG: DUF1800 family protein [Sphingobacteriales bacterium]